MKSQEIWTLFEKTGSPQLYLLFCNVRKLETENAFENSSFGFTGCKLQ